MFGFRVSLPGLAIALAAGAALASPARADCQLLIEPMRDQWLVQYDPLADDSRAAQFDVAITNLGDTPCQGRLQTELRGEQFGLTQPSSAERVFYSIVAERAAVDLTPRSGASSRRATGQTVVIAPGERSLERFSFAFDGDQMASSGVYSQTLFLAVEDASGLRAERAVSLAVSVPRTAVVGLKGQFSRAAGVPVIDLGELTEGDRPLQAFVYVQSTGGYSLAVSSANFGRLRLGDTDWYVDYRLALDDRDVNLAQGGLIEAPLNQKQADNYRMGIHIGSIAAKRAGRYSDTLTFVVAAL